MKSLRLTLALVALSLCAAPGCTCVRNCWNRVWHRRPVPCVTDPCPPGGIGPAEPAVVVPSGPPSSYSPSPYGAPMSPYVSPAQ